ncbi:MAG: bifunctional adenosylcobinamide kinase/adenosylcobinamide-phosphate guanylyltransferase [Tannerellaceae bacterium]|nr:bifunctional adenosylcobinamide kinase/adenosylcobinamide-phosphate guanylyltransferase [Tannerellaceae bacterium]
MKRIILITGGQRSGKSSYVQQLALSLSDHPVYLATSRIWDEEHRKRIERHQQDRGNEWENIEEEKFLFRHALAGKTIVIDCVTLWATNFFFDNDSDVEQSLAELKKEFIQLVAQPATFIFVTNEIGLGGTSSHEIQRKFTDLSGWFNQFIARQADEVICMFSGLPMKIK